MAQLMVLMAGLLFIAQSQASDMVDRSTSQRFLSGYLPDSKSSLSEYAEYAKFITPNLNRVKQGLRPDALSSHNPPTEPSPNMGASPITIVDDKPVLHLAAQTQDSMAFTAARGETSISTKDFNPLTIADREKLLTDDRGNPIALSAIGIGLFSLVTMLGVLLRRGLQPANVLSSSGELGPVMAMNTASALVDNVMEMKAQGSNLACQVNYSTVGWGQLSSQNAPPLRLSRRCASASDAEADDVIDDDATLFSKKKAAEFKIPVEVYDTTPPQNLVGVYPLSPTVGCGDILRVDKEEQYDAYVIKRVESRKKWREGKFVLDSMRADATEVNRASLEKRLRRLLPTE